LLTAIEDTLSKSLKTDTLPHSPTAYFISLLQCLEKACSDETDGGDEDAMAETENMGQGGLIPATLYLLAIVVPETPGNVVVSKLSTVMECILPLFESAMEHPPALKSLITIITSVIGFASPQVLNSSPLLKKSWNYLLELNLDPRPKVRHVAQEGVRKVLTTPVPPKVVAGNHPYLPKAREWVVGILEEETKTGGASGTGGKKKARFADADDGEGKRAIWVVQGLRGWSAVWGESVCFCSFPQARFD
jgi:ribosomal RNA-processing protein 12